MHNHGQSNQVKLATTYAYDHQGRLLSEKMDINDSGTPTTLAAYTYNELGEQIAKYLHGSSSGSDFNQKVDYVYNIKGWLRKQNQITSLGTDLFAQELKYQDSGNPSSYFNGNIWQTGWLNTGDIAKNYTFSYDEVNRLESAVYSDGVNNGDFDTGYTYDANGNISTLSRKANGTPVDVLTYSYISTGNKLQSVTDGGNTEGYFAVPGEDYEYDANGNMKTDPSKGTGIEYNYLSLPSRVTFDLDDEIRYTYDAAGNKLVKAIQIDGTTGEGRLNYCGNFLYEGTNLKAIFTSAGRIIPFDNGGETIFKFEYNLQDHLGNTRVVFSGHSNGQPEVMQVTDYYPFGMVMNQQNYFASGVLSNKYLYNNKELQDDELAGNSLGWYDYGFRFYDPALGRFTGIDPISEKFYHVTTYNYAENSPIANIDYWGLQAVHFQKGLELNKPFNQGYNAQRTTKIGEVFSQKLKSQNKFDVLYFPLKGYADGRITDIGKLQDFDRLHPDFTNSLSKKLDIQPLMKEGKSLILIGVNEQELDGGKEDAKDTGKILNHEEFHGIDRLNGDKYDQDSEHEIYTGNKASGGYTPNTKKGSLADRENKKIEKYIEENYEK